jgi:predicted amidohydrolase
VTLFRNWPSRLTVRRRKWRLQLRGRQTLLCSIIGPDGYPLLKTGPGKNGVFCSNLELSAITATRKENPVLTDRRPELYAAAVKKI